MAVSPKASPIQTLRDHVTHLEAAITLCLADPKPKPVHLLRTTTRRIEAQLTLLSLLPHLPPHRKQAKKAQRLLKELRRAAGQVRDLDVQRDLIKDKTSAATQKESLQLRNALKDQRTQTEADLLQILDKHQSKLALTLESLLEALAPAERLSLTPTQLTHLTQSWFTRNIPSTHDDPDQLHTIRKTAKLARYIAETAPNSARTARKVAASFESLQQSGGEWHDWLILAAIAEDHLGKSSPLTQTFHRQCQTSLTTYRNHLHTFTPTPSTKKKGRASRATLV
ncbi:MAG TPA: CHAD domain-containing protein [Edaphobacter sp.]|nr:CHAD domain-containing protein [Edaphobacter sp.]